RSVLLTSGAMTNRIDRLEAAGLVERLRPPGDRRSILVGLTPSGAQLADVATPIRLDEARAALAGLTPQEARQLADLLRAMALT
ncbi:MAG: MarR family transcriptional regulator, partial [Gemmatimonadetes bacterium]|nr:MarR family transcriptional regulator [Gemmatimonadota bacterium]NIT65702.1 MarR family transcriptional regulator [Gemmatimonadota bacterium]NIW74174.1 MarR family transcriptional regulator [Gemmatimonadota bacterium]NIY34280.1 MarR family transcriptional regulator [Gemmatimonadota bacterium]